MDVGLNVAGVKSRQRRLWYQIKMVHDGETVRDSKPGRRLGIGNDVDVPMFREKFLEGTQAMSEFVIVAKPTFNIAVNGHGVTVANAHFLNGPLALQSPDRVVAVYPKVNNIDGFIVFHKNNSKKKT